MNDVMTNEERVAVLTARSGANDVADWIERERQEAIETGRWLEKRAFVQNVDLIVAALREYGAKE